MLAILLFCGSNFVFFQHSSFDVSLQSDAANLDVVKNASQQQQQTIGSNKIIDDASANGNSIHNKADDDDDDDTKAPVVAYAISLIECHGEKGAGFLDAALVLRHSIHLNSVRNPDSGSKYDYKMYAIVHEQAKSCAPTLELAGFHVLIRSPPLDSKDIKGDFLRRKIYTALCCGHHEFIKLYAYQLFDEKVVVHLDIDFIFHQPMDDVIDVMMTGDRTHKDRIPVEGDFVWPDGEIETMFTRDWPSINAPGRKSGFQAGFWVLKPSQKHFDKLVEIVLEGNYVEGFSRENGWGGLGYGGFVGGMAMQGLLAYYYDQFVPGTWVELNHCRFNHIGVDVRVKGKCRNGKEACEQCQSTPVQDIYSVHYTACRKPWQCMAKGTKDKDIDGYSKKQLIHEHQVNKDHCMELLKIWHGVRTDLEHELFKLTRSDAITGSQKGEYNSDAFLGHCTQDLEAGYLKLASGKDEVLQRIPELYGDGE